MWRRSGQSNHGLGVRDFGTLERRNGKGFLRMQTASSLLKSVPLSESKKRAILGFLYLPELGLQKKYLLDVQC